MFNSLCRYGNAGCLCSSTLEMPDALRLHANSVLLERETTEEAMERLFRRRRQWLTGLRESAEGEVLNCFADSSGDTCDDAASIEYCGPCNINTCSIHHECDACELDRCDCTCCPECNYTEPNSCASCQNNECCGCSCDDERNEDGYDQAAGPLREYNYDVTEYTSFIRDDSEKRQQILRLDGSFTPHLNTLQKSTKKKLLNMHTAFRKRTPWLGVELEVYDATEDWHETIPAFEDKLSGILGTAACQDSSLDDKPYSFEIKIAPATLKYHQRVYWPAFQRANQVGTTITARKFRAFDVKGYGLHVHIDRSVFNVTSEEKLNLFINHPLNAEFIMDIAQRYSAQWAKLQPTGVSTVLQSNRQDDKYIGLNFQHSNTLEFRFFKSTTNIHSVMRSLEFVDACYRFVKYKATFNTLDYPSFVKMVVSNEYHNDYPRLVRWMVEKGYAVYSKRTRDYTVPELECPFIVLSHNEKVVEEDKPNEPSNMRDFTQAHLRQLPLSTKAVCIGYHFEDTLKGLREISQVSNSEVHKVLSYAQSYENGVHTRDLEGIGDIVCSLIASERAASQNGLKYIRSLLSNMPDVDNKVYNALIADIGINMRNAETVRFLRGVIGQCIEDGFQVRTTLKVLRGLYQVFKIVALSDGYIRLVVKNKLWTDSNLDLLEGVDSGRHNSILFKELYSKILPCFIPYNRKKTKLEKTLLERTGYE